MKHPLFILILALTCATLHAQSVIVKGTGAGAVHATGAGSIWGVIYTTTNTYSDGRFEVRSDNTSVVVDNDSGLTWTRDANLGGTMNWSNAGIYCSNLTYAGSSDWRLPSMVELSRDVAEGATNGLVDAYPSANNPALPLGHPFTSIQAYYWSSTSIGIGAWYVNLQDGDIGNALKSFSQAVWPCRGP